MSRALRRAAKLSVRVTCLPAGEINDHFAPPVPKREQQLKHVTETEFRRMCCDWVTVGQKKPASRVGASAPQASTRVGREDDWTEGPLAVKPSARKKSPGPRGRGSSRRKVAQNTKE
jgi:hypothetical protein